MSSGSLSSAGKIVGRSQPSVSRILDALEHEIGVSLFERRRGQVVPTEAAHELLDELQRVLVSMKRITDFAEQRRAENIDTIQIGVMPALATSFIPKVITRFAKQFPSTKIILNVRFSPTIEEWATTQQIDIGLAEAPFRRTGFETIEFSRSPYVIAVPSRHHLAKNDVIEPADLLESPLISWTPFAAARQLSDAIFRASGIWKTPLYETTLSLSGLALVENEMGLGIIDPFTGLEHQSDGVTLVPFRPEIPFNVAMLLPEGRRKSAALDAFITELNIARDELVGKIGAT